MKPRLLPAVAIAGVVLMLAAPAAAQSLLSLPDAIDAAMSGNPSLGAMRAGREQARARTREAQADWFPRIQFSESWRRSTQPVAGFGTLLNAGRFTAADFAVDRLNAPGAFDGFVRRVGVSEVIFDGGRTRALVNMSARQADATDARLQAAEADLALRVTDVYGRIVALTAAAESARAALAWATEDRTRAEARRRAGTATDADVLAISVMVADMRQRQLQAESDLAITHASLNELMGAPLAQRFDVVLPPLPSTAPDLGDLTAEARHQRPELRDAAHTVAIADAGKRAARSGLWPTLAAEAGYEWNGLDFANRQSAWTVGAELRWSLSTGGADAARIAAARAGADAARASQDAAGSAVDLEVLTARERWTLALAKIDAGRAATDEAHESQRIIRQRYSAGMASTTELLAAASATLSAEARDTANRVDAITAWAALQRAVGRSLSTVSR